MFGTLRVELEGGMGLGLDASLMAQPIRDRAEIFPVSCLLLTKTQKMNGELP